MEGGVDSTKYDINFLERKNSHSQDKDIRFQEKGHIYYVKGKTGFTSVTKFVHGFSKPFDADAVITKMLASGKNKKYEGMTASEIKKQWNNNGLESRTMGTAMHYAIECYFNNVGGDCLKGGILWDGLDKECEQFENKTILYSIKDKKIFDGKTVSIFGGGDSALDWALELSKTSKVNLIHRRDEFRAAQATVDKVKELSNSGKINLITNSQLKTVSGNGKLEEIEIENDNKETKKLKTDFALGFFGLIMQLGPIANWGLNLNKKTVEVDTEKFETNQKGIYAVGDICNYPGKLKLILSGFHEGALAARACFKLARPNEKYRFEFTTSSKTIKNRLGVKSD